jgi:hypothetical protein
MVRNHVALTSNKSQSLLFMPFRDPPGCVCTRDPRANSSLDQDVCVTRRGGSWSRINTRAVADVAVPCETAIEIDPLIHKQKISPDQNFFDTSISRISHLSDL